MTLKPLKRVFLQVGFIMTAFVPAAAGAQSNSAAKSGSDAFAGCRGSMWSAIMPAAIGPFLFSPSAPQKGYAIARLTPNLWRFESRQGDGNSAGRGSDRAEMVAQYSRGTPCNTVGWRRDIWHSFAMRVSGNVGKDGKWLVVGQWHGVPDAGDVDMSPVLAQSFTDGVFKISTRFDKNRVQFPGRLGNPRTVYEDRRFPWNTWVNFVYHIRFDYAGDGLLQVWRDGKLISNLRDVPIGYNDARGPRYQFGIYRQANSVGDFAVEYANHEFSPTSLIDRVARPVAVR